MADIELVIKIPEEKYKEIITYKEGCFKLGYFETIIANGIPLPKGHGRLIDADAYAKRYSPTNINGRIGEEYIIAPTIIEADKAESEE